MVYAIYEDFFPDVEKKLNRIAKKCAKHGNEFVFKINGEEIREHENDGITEYYKFILIEVEGTAKIDDWECIAVLEIHNAGNIIRRINTDINMPERFKTSENICEHCNSKRGRKNLYVIHNIKTDEWKQVGGDCLKLYTGGLSIEYVAHYMDGITELEEYNGHIAAHGTMYYKVENVLSYAVEVIGKTGYFNSNSILPTKYLVMNFCCEKDISDAIKKSNEEIKQHKLDVYLKRDDFLKPDTYDTVEKIVEYYKGLKDNSEFIHNIKLMLDEGYITIKHFGFLCYLPQGYAKHIEQEIERAKRLEEKHEYFGEIGKRYKNVKIIHAERLTSWETLYGCMNLYKFILESGEILTWKTSNYLYDCEYNDRYYDVNGTYKEWITEDDNKGHWEEHYIVIDSITFTVKEHKTYNDQKQTEITRCKLIYKTVE